MQPSSLRDVSSEQLRRLDRAVRHVTQMWFPFNPKSLERIRTSIVDGRYDLEIDSLIDDLKSDPALFSYCIKELSRIARDEKVPIPEEGSTLALFQWAGPQRILDLFAEPGKISAHNFESMNSLQALRLKESTVSGATSELFCEKKEVDPLVGFTTSQLRQLGMNLIAWNYPTVYRRAVEVATDATSLSDELSKTLGFSPPLLAMAVVAQWIVAPSTRAAIAPANSKAASLEVGSTGFELTDFLSHICDVGEALASVSSGSTALEPPRGWALIREEVVQTLGDRGLKEIEERTTERLKDNIEASPKLFAPITGLEAAIAERALPTLDERNPFARGLPEPIRNNLRELYRLIDTGCPIKDQLNHFAHRVIPSAGFEGGRVYTVDPVEHTLVPRLQFGRLEGSAVRDGVVALSGDKRNPVIEAYSSSDPILATVKHPLKNDEQIAAVVLGIKKKVGVLYLEAGDGGMLSLGVDPAILIKALQRALMESLKVK